MSTAILEALGVACELTSTTLSEGAMRVLSEELSTYPESQVLGALRQCCRQLKTRLSLAEILSRLNDGRPGVEEAWAIVCHGMHDEAATIVWTDEMREAFGVARQVGDDQTGARMTFKEQYLSLVQQSRDNKLAPNWSVSLGTDKAGRELAIVEGVKAGRLLPDYARRLLPDPIDGQAVELLQKYAPNLLT